MLFPYIVYFCGGERDVNKPNCINNETLTWARFFLSDSYVKIN